MATEQAQQPKTSRVGKLPVDVPKGVQVTINANKVAVKGPKGALERAFDETVSVAQDGDVLRVSCNAEGSAAPRLQGLSRALLSNMVVGVSEGYTKTLELVGTGYRAELKGKVLSCSVGFASAKDFTVPDGITIDIPKDSKGQVVHIQGASKEAVGQLAATVRGCRPPEPYGGKGIRYRGERIREKAGKTGK